MNKLSVFQFSSFSFYKMQYNLFFSFNAYYVHHLTFKETELSIANYIPGTSSQAPNTSNVTKVNGRQHFTVLLKEIS